MVSGCRFQSAVGDRICYIRVSEFEKFWQGEKVFCEILPGATAVCMCEFKRERERETKSEDLAFCRQMQTLMYAYCELSI